MFHRAALALLVILGLTACKKAEIPIPAPTFKPKKVFENASLFSSTPIGNSFEGKPWISHVKVVDLDLDGKDDILACEGQHSTVLWLKWDAAGRFVERQLADKMNAPVHAETADLDDDGDLDILVSTMGEIFPNNDRIGSLIVLENDGSQQFKKRVLLENVARVTDARAGDFNGDGKLDIAVAQFGYDQGEIRWLENTGPWQYKSHILLDLSGGINVCLADFDQDGSLDIVALLSQQWEEIYLFQNDGRGNFRSKIIFGSTNEEFNSSWINLCDLNQDGLEDVLFSNGDGYGPTTLPGPRPWHGVQWLENRGEGKFQYHHIGKLPGAYSPIGMDVDKDGAMDVIAVSSFNDWWDANAVSMMWFRNEGDQEFSSHILAYEPTHLLSLAVGHFDDSGNPSIVSGAFHAYPPYDKLSRLMLWQRKQSE